MRTVRTLASSADRFRILARFPTKTLVLSLTIVIVALSGFALVDRLVPTPAQPSEKAVTAKPASEKVPNPSEAKVLGSKSPQVFSMGSLVAIVAVLGGALGVMFVLKRVLKGSRHIPSDKKLLKVRDVLAIGPKRAIYLIGLEDRNLVVGLSGDQLTLLSEYSADQEGLQSAAAEPNGGRTGEIELARAPAVLQTPGRPASTLDIEVGGEITVPVDAPAPSALESAPLPRAFSFAAANANKNRPPKSHSERVPHKFRQLLEQASEADGARR